MNFNRGLAAGIIVLGAPAYEIRTCPAAFFPIIYPFNLREQQHALKKWDMRIHLTLIKWNYMNYPFFTFLGPILG